MSHVLQPEEKEGNREQVPVADRNVKELLQDLLKEMQKMNIYLAIMTDENISDDHIGMLS